jgi:transmembrane 9 superfamily member 2/4
VDKAKEVIRDGFVAEWIVDNLPGATSFVTTDKTRKYYAAGFKMGWMEVPDDPSLNPTYFLNNHHTLVFRYHRAPGKDGDKGNKVIVGFEVYPKSITSSGRNKDGLPKDVHHPKKPMQLELPEEEGATIDIPYTYSIYFVEEPHREWGNRWDMYFVNQEDSHKVHWLAIINSLVICALLTAVVAVIFTRTIRGELKGQGKDSPEDGRPRRKTSKENGTSGLLDQPEANPEAELEEDEEGLDETTGWKLLHGDVFRPPPWGGLLAPLVGSGTQLVFMAAGILTLGSLGILNPSFRGGYISTGIALFIVAGVFSGYFSARLFKTFGGQDWQKNLVMTGSLIPGLLFFAIFYLNLFVWAQSSSTAIPFSTLIALLSLWLLIQLPLVYVGTLYGFKRVGAYEHPTHTTSIPRQIPQNQTWRSARTIQMVLGAGLIPFAVIFIELLFVFRSMWQDKSGYYYVFGFMSVVAAILIITVIEVTIVATYVLLCWEVSPYAGCSLRYVPGLTL